MKVGTVSAHLRVTSFDSYCCHAAGPPTLLPDGPDYVLCRFSLPKLSGPAVIQTRAALRELTTTATAVFVVLFSVLLSTQLIRLLGQAAGGKLVPEAVTALLGFVALGYLPTLFSLTLFLAVLLTFSRWYRDSEMSIWLASGISLSQWIGVVLRFGWPILVLVTVLSLWLSPWAQLRAEAYRQQLAQRDDVARVAPGAFNESAGGERVFFVEGLSAESNRVQNVFVSAEKDGEVAVIATAGGYVETADNGDRFLVLQGGRRYDTRPGSAEYRMMEFERYGVRIETRDALPASGSMRTRSTSDLIAIRTPGALSELLWRIGVPVSALVLTVLAIPLSFVNPRGGRASNLAAALFLYLIYNNFLSVSQAWVAQEKISFSVGVWAIHVLMMIIAAVLFAYRELPMSWRRVLHR
jgi:lipopolysaccharide export system permease protein